MRLLAIVGAAAWLAMPAPCVAAPAAHSAQPAAGESLEALSQRLYGTPLAAAALRSFNDLAPGSPLPKVLRVPYSKPHRVAPGETWSSLARSWFGGRLSGEDLARLVGRTGDSAPVAGEQVPVPVLIQDRLARGETLAALSRRHYGRSDGAALLMRFNGIRDPRRLFVGSRVEVPLVLREPTDRSPTPSASREDESNRPPAVSSAPPGALGEFEASLRDAVNSYLDGDYARSRQQLEDLRPAVLARGNPGEQRLLLEQLVFVYSAFDETDRACESLAALVTLAPDLEFDPDLVSPKVRELRDHCP
ncbi:MAG: LysM peptidoglycan-binding domain-containing protein [Myxococcota bacterium]